jgi:hydroxyacylglutathione hydrolase
MIVEIIPCLSDNYSYLIHEKETGTISIVDPSEFNACDKILNDIVLKFVFFVNC